MGKRKKLPRRGTFGSGSFIVLYEDMLSALAFRVLSPTEKLVLVDMLRIYRKASKGDTGVVLGGFNYTWSHCKTDVSERAFYKSRRRIVELGFFKVLGEDQAGRLGESHRFSTSELWKKDERVTAEQRRKLMKSDEAKKAKLKRGRDRKTDYLTKGKPKKNQRTSRQGYGAPKSGVAVLLVRDAATQNTPSRRTFRQGYIDTISGALTESGHEWRFPAVGPQVDAGWLGGLTRLPRPSPLALSVEVRKLVNYDAATMAVFAANLN